jgi:hypothetical protein
MSRSPELHEVGSTLHTALLSYALQHIEDGWQHIRTIMTWIDAVSEEKAVQAKFMEWDLLEATLS